MNLDDVISWIQRIVDIKFLNAIGAAQGIDLCFAHLSARYSNLCRIHFQFHPVHDFFDFTACATFAIAGDKG